MARTIVKRKNRRRPATRPGRRKTDAYFSIGRLAGLIGFPCAAILGQAELIGEPERHVVTIVAIVCTSVWAYGTKPDFLHPLMKAVRGKWLK